MSALEGWPITPIYFRSSDPWLMLSWCLLVVPISCKSASAQHAVEGQVTKRNKARWAYGLSQQFSTRTFWAFSHFQWVTRKVFSDIILFIGVQMNKLEVRTSCSGCTTVFCRVFSSSHMVCCSTCAINSIVSGLSISPHWAKWKRLWLHTVPGGNGPFLLPGTGKLT